MPVCIQFIAIRTSLTEWQCVWHQTHWRQTWSFHWLVADDTILLLGPTWLNLSLSLVLTFCDSWSLSFISSFCVNLIRIFICNDALHKKAIEDSVRAINLVACDFGISCSYAVTFSWISSLTYTLIISWKVSKGARSGIDTIKYHTWPRIPMGKWQTHS